MWVPLWVMLKAMLMVRQKDSVWAVYLVMLTVRQKDSVYLVTEKEMLMDLSMGSLMVRQKDFV